MMSLRPFPQNQAERRGSHTTYLIGKIVNSLNLDKVKREHWHYQHSLVNVGEEGLSPHKLKNEKVINYSS